MAGQAGSSTTARSNVNSRVLSDFESDSEDDPGFIPGPVPIAELQSWKGKKKPQRRSLKRRDSMQSDTAEQPAKKRKRMGAPPTQRRGPVADSAHNVLLEFFEDIEPCSGGSSDEGDCFAQDEADQEDEDEEDDDDGHNDSDSVPRVNPFAAYRSNAAESIPPIQPRKFVPPPDDPDATEPDTEDEIPISKQRRKASPTDDSVTESDTEPEIANARRVLNGRAAQPQSGSETEPDTEDEAPVSSQEEPKPGFPLQDGQKLLGPMTLDQKMDIKVPAAINTYLREYQRDGIRFFWERYKMRRGGLLGDDMGKTIQVISFLSAIMHKKGVETDRERRREHVLRLQDGESWTRHRKLPPANATWPTCLIIAPNSVVMNWEKEFRTWGYFEVGVYLGPRKERKEVLDDFKKGRLDVVLTSQDVARLDMDHLDTLPWSCIFVDEAHKVKNSASRTAKAYQSFACICRFGLTGTAIQNSYDELWTQFDWTNPGEVGTRKQWKQLVSNPLKIGQSANATDAELVKAHDVARILHDKLLPRFFLRRTKDIIAHQLPNKTDSIVFCPLTSKQISVYKRILGMDEVQNLLLRDESCDCGSRKTRKKCCYPFNASTVLKTMSILIKLSNHLGLILPTSSDTPEQAARHRELARLAFPDGDEPVSGMAILKKQFCGKWVVLTELLAEWRKDKTNKVLIFTKSVKLLEMMSHHLKISTYNFLQLDGSTKRNERIPMIDRFNDDPDIFVFLISTMAGGTGLNLTGANKVVIFDPNWNPANDLQAMDRAFRFGQRRDVSVFRLLGAGSIEELIYARQVYKQQQMKIGYEASIQTRYFAGVQGDKSKQGELFGLENIFKLHEGTLATKTTIEKAHLTELDWALGSMEMPAGRRPAEISVVDIEKRTRDSEYGEFKGLGALLFDDAAPPAPKSESGAIQGMYIHQNPDLLVDSKVEQQRTKELVKKSRVSTRKARQPATAKAPAVSNWPPKRFHKYKNPGTKPPVAAAASEAKKAGSSKPRAGHQFRLEDRITALIGTGMISGPSELAAFARTFTQEYSADERAYTMRLLDEYKQDSESDSDG